MQAKEYAHVFLFRCPACHRALTSICFKSENSLEMADEHVFRSTCDCGWAGRLAGHTAVRHWVKPWGLVWVKCMVGLSKSTRATRRLDSLDHL